MILLRSVFLNFFLRIALGCLQVLITAVLTRMMSVEGYGQFSILILNATLFNLVTSIGLDSSITYHTSAGLVSPRNSSRSIWIVILLQAVILILLYLFRPMPPLATSLSLDSNIQVLIVMMALVVGFSLQDKFGALFNGLQRYSIFSITLSLAALACLVALCWRYFVGGEHLQRDGMVIYVLFTLLPAMVLAIAFYFDHHRANGSRNGLFSALRLLAPFSLFSYVTNTIQLLAYRIDYWILDHYHPGAPLGWYSLAVRLIQVLWFLPVVMATIFFPEAASSKGMPATTLSRAIRHLNGLNLLLLVLLLLVIRPAISVFFGDTYLPSAYLVLLLLPGMVSFGITTLIASYMAGENRLRVNFIGSSICLILVLILDLTLIPRWGASGAAMASSIAYLGTTIYFILVYRARSGSTLRQLFLPSFKEVRELPGMLRKLTKIIGTS